MLYTVPASWLHTAGASQPKVLALPGPSYYLPGISFFGEVDFHHLKNFIRTKLLLLQVAWFTHRRV